MKIGFVSLGCPKNLVDSEVMLGLVRQAGHDIVTDAAAADVLVVNTCAFIESAKQESVDAILELAEYKRTGRCSRLVVTGCLAERYRDELRKEIGEIDVVLGTGDVPEIVRAIEHGGADAGIPLRVFRRNARTRAEILPESALRQAQHALSLSKGGIPNPESQSSVPPTYIYDADTPRYRATPRHFAYVKIAEGCDYTCAFCIIPSLRGRYRSRPADSVVREAHRLAEEGVRELILISQDTTFYGIDRGKRGALSRLLHELNAIDGLAWIRLLYLYPTTITDDTLDAIGECDKVCKYIDLPLQHAAPSVLARMRRPGTRDTYERLLTRVRMRLPGVALRTTFIVGFPGETEPEFRELCNFAREMRFDHLGVFRYSHEADTRAYGFADDVPSSTKGRRQRELMALQKQLVQRAQRRRVGQVTRVMIDGPSPESALVWQARLAAQAPDIDSVVYLTDCDPSAYAPGQLIKAEIVEARDYDLIGRPLPDSETA